MECYCVRAEQQGKGEGYPSAPSTRGIHSNGTRFICKIPYPISIHLSRHTTRTCF